MAILPDVFKPADNKSSLLDPGWYVAQIVKSDLKDTKDKSGKRLTFVFRIVEGDQSGKTVFIGLNIRNRNPDAQAIANRELANICECCGIDELEDTEQLHGVPLGILVDIEQGNAQYPDRNNIKKYAAVDDIPDDNESDNPFG